MTCYLPCLLFDDFYAFIFRFVPSRVASQAITRSIKQQFLSPWPSWGAIPPEEKEPFWQRFKVKRHETYFHSIFMYVFQRKSRWSLLLDFKYHAYCVVNIICT